MKFWMLLNLPKPVWAPNDGGGAGDPDPGTGDPDPGAGDPDPGAAKWWEGDALNDAQRTQITALGLTVDDPVQAVARLADMERNAKTKLGKPADQLMDRPAEGQDVAEWLRSNGELFGVPDTADAYDVAKPDDWPTDAVWNTDMEVKAREIGHKHGLSGAALNDMVGLYAGEVQRLLGDADTDLAQATETMQTELQRDWGPQYASKVAQAQQAASVVAEKAGLDQDALAGLAGALKPKVGDAGTIRLFAAIGAMMGDDTAVALTTGGGALGTTPAEARAQLAEMRGQDGAYAKAVASGDKVALKRLTPEIDRLSKIAAG